MTTIVLASQAFDLGFLVPLLRAQDASVQVCTVTDVAASDAEVMVCWDLPPTGFGGMPRLRLVHSVAAGADLILAAGVPPGVSVCRVVDTQQAQGMWEFVLWSALNFHRGLDHADAAQRAKHWRRQSQLPAAGFRIGVMGLGKLGTFVATRLAAFGYDVKGWATSPRELPGVSVLSGDAAYPAFLSQCDLLVCLLPLTSSTRGILSADTFRRLPEGAALVHCGRGEHLVEGDLLAALDSGHLRGAVVDVFAREPLPSEHMFWKHPRIRVTPHMAASPTAETIAAQIAANVGRLRRGEPLANAVGIARGY